jgi:hypothetical protein
MINVEIVDHLIMRVLRLEWLGCCEGKLSSLKRFLPEPRETGDNEAHPLESSSEDQQ